MKNAIMLFLAACPKGGGTMSTETGGLGGGGGSIGGEGGGTEGARSSGDTEGMSIEERTYWKGEDDYLFRKPWLMTNL